LSQSNKFAIDNSLVTEKSDVYDFDLILMHTFQSGGPKNFFIEDFHVVSGLVVRREPKE
jgi:hypothetical protein